MELKGRVWVELTQDVVDGRSVSPTPSLFRVPGLDPIEIIHDSLALLAHSTRIYAPKGPITDS
jgi:hypothetical protein